MIALRPIRRKEGSPIVRLATETFGEGYIKLDDINDRYMVVRVNGKFAGFANTEIWDEEDCDGEDGFSLGLIESVAVHPDFRGLGLGNILVAGCTAPLIQEGCDLIECYATTWRNNGVCYIKGALERSGFTVKQFFPQYWKDDPPKYTCRGCHSTPCLCDATLYQREVNRS